MLMISSPGAAVVQAEDIQCQPEHRFQLGVGGVAGKGQLFTQSFPQAVMGDFGAVPANLHRSVTDKGNGLRLHELCVLVAVGLHSEAPEGLAGTAEGGPPAGESLPLWLRCLPADALPEQGGAGIVSPDFQPGGLAGQLAMLMVITGGHDSFPADKPQGIQ